jgi:hypothetical protein
MHEPDNDYVKSKYVVHKNKTSNLFQRYNGAIKRYMLRTGV